MAENEKPIVICYFLFSSIYFNHFISWSSMLRVYQDVQNHMNISTCWKYCIVPFNLTIISFYRGHFSGKDKVCQRNDRCEWMCLRLCGKRISALFVWPSDDQTNISPANINININIANWSFHYHHQPITFDSMAIKPCSSKLPWSSLYAIWWLNMLNLIECLCIHRFDWLECRKSVHFGCSAIHE